MSDSEKDEVEQYLRPTLELMSDGRRRSASELARALNLPKHLKNRFQGLLQRTSGTGKPLAVSAGAGPTAYVFNPEWNPNHRMAGGGEGYLPIYRGADGLPTLEVTVLFIITAKCNVFKLKNLILSLTELAVIQDELWALGFNKDFLPNDLDPGPVKVRTFIRGVEFTNEEIQDVLTDIASILQRLNKGAK